MMTTMMTVTSNHDQQPYRSTSPPNQLASKENDRELHCMITTELKCFYEPSPRAFALASHLSDFEFFDTLRRRQGEDSNHSFFFLLFPLLVKRDHKLFGKVIQENVS